MSSADETGNGAPAPAAAPERKRVAVILSGCGNRDGSEIRETLFTMLALERANVEIVFFAPDKAGPVVMNHLTGEPSADEPVRNVLVESARLARGKIAALSTLDPATVDAAIFPGGLGAGKVLSNFLEKGSICEVDPEVTRTIRALFSAHKPLGFICLSPILAARILGPLAGVRITLGPRGTSAAKHAAVMGADVRPCLATDIVIDENTRVVSTPAYMCDDVTLPQILQGIEKLVRSVVNMTRQPKQQPGQHPRNPRANERDSRSARGPVPPERQRESVQVRRRGNPTPGRGSV
jgi:enhancing lycopene biosynthesis protein 2